MLVDEVLGYFNPSTFTIKTSFKPDLAKWPEVHFDLTEESIRGFSNFIHELTHYLQFTGTVFGLKYQLARLHETMILVNLLRRSTSQDHYVLPFIRNGLSDGASDDHDAIAMARHLREQSNHVIAGSSQRRAWRSNIPVQSLPDTGLNVPGVPEPYPLAGLVAMENWATWNQHLLIGAPAVPESVRARLRNEYVHGRNIDYTIINDTLARTQHDYLAPIIYWIAFNPPLMENDDWQWLSVRVSTLVEAASRLPNHSLTQFFESAADIEADLCDAAGYERPLECLRSAIQEIEANGTDIIQHPEICITLDVLRWIVSKESVLSIILWPAVASLLKQDFHLTPFLGFPIWLIEYEGQPENERLGHFVHNYPAEFFGAFEQMRLLRSILPIMAWGGTEAQRFRCPVPQLRICATSCDWCGHVFHGPRPQEVEKSLCYLGESLGKGLGVDMDRFSWS